MFRSNLGQFLRGGTKRREMLETEHAWEETQALWRRSPLERGLFDLSLALTVELRSRAERTPPLGLQVAIAEAFESLLAAEDIGSVEPVWPAIEHDIDAAMEFREMLVRRRRWATDFDRLYGTFRAAAFASLEEFIGGLPEGAFAESDSDRSDSFEVALVDLLDEPARAIERLFMLPYDDDAFRYDVFSKLRERCATNLLIASGFPPNDDPRRHEGKLVLPTLHKSKVGADLADLYLRGSPLKALLEIPVSFHIPHELRFEHCHIVGGTGHGKTQLMQKMIHADLVASQSDGRSVIVIDSQGDLINKLVRLDLFSPSRENGLAERLIVIDPSDVEFPAALNLFDAHLDRVRDYSAVDRERVLNGVIELYELFFGAFLGAELTQKQGVIFKYLARLMLAIPDATIHTLMRIMEDGKPYKPFMEQLNGSARYFFETEFFHPSFAATKKQVLRRLWGVLSTPAFERMFTQPKNKLDLFEAMNEGKIIFVSTAKELLKRDGSQLLGRFFIAMIAQAALERSTLPEHRRNAAFVYIDEAQEYFDDNIETILSQARKYHVGLTLAHQTLDQLSPRLRSAMLANTSMKCAGGVSSKDARSLADELRTTSAFIESMKRQAPRTEFAVWVKHLTGQAVRLSVPLGFLERQPTLDDEEYEALISANRARYCGTLADIPVHASPPPAAEPANGRGELHEAQDPDAPKPNRPAQPPSHRPEPAGSEPAQREPAAARAAYSTDRPPVPERELGKGGQQHRYLQSLVRELADQQGLKATIEAPVPGGSGQVDVLLERDAIVAAVEISITTPADWERENLRKCLGAGIPRVALVLAKSKRSQAQYKAAISDALTSDERARVAFLAPEELPDFIASLAPPPPATERVVRGYRVTGTLVESSPQEAAARRDAITRIIARSVLRDK